MSTLTKLTRSVKELEVPRPRKSTGSTTQALPRSPVNEMKSVDDLVWLTEAVANQLAQGNYQPNVITNVASMCRYLKLHGSQLEQHYKSILDRFFVVFRNGSQDERLDHNSRLHLLELIELRAKNWHTSDFTNQYYRHKVTNTEPLLVPMMDSVVSMGGSVSPTLATPEPPPVLSPGEVIKTSGKFLKPTKIPGKNYSKDEVVIRNADSGKELDPVFEEVARNEETAPSEDNVSDDKGSENVVVENEASEDAVVENKVTDVEVAVEANEEIETETENLEVMGIKGRRVHMIEELSDTIISFQRVSPGAKERLVQITGPNEENVNHAKHLIGDTIRRNASPVRLEQAVEGLRDSAGSLHSSGSDEGPRPMLGGNQKLSTNNRALHHSFSTNDAAIGEYKYTVSYGQHSLKITGSNLDFVKAAKLVLDEYFEREEALERGEGSGDFFTLSHRTALLSHGEEHYPNGLPSPTGDDEVFHVPEDNGTEAMTFRRPRFSRATSIQKEGAGAKQTYTKETLVQLSASPLSKGPPASLAAVPPELARKSVLDFDGEAYMKRARAGGTTLVVSPSDEVPDSPEPE